MGQFLNKNDACYNASPISVYGLLCAGLIPSASKMQQNIS